MEEKFSKNCLDIWWHYKTQELVIIIEPHIIHKSKNNVSLSDLGYEGLSNDLLDLEYASKNAKKAQKSEDNTTKNEK